jgi:hypothetical protein
MHTNLRLIYMSLFITRDDGPEERASWWRASEKEQRAAACSFHEHYGGTCPAWALAR